jgi:hypothetical protein
MGYLASIENETTPANEHQLLLRLQAALAVPSAAELDDVDKGEDDDDDGEDEAEKEERLFAPPGTTSEDDEDEGGEDDKFGAEGHETRSFLREWKRTERERRRAERQRKLRLLLGLPVDLAPPALELLELAPASSADRGALPASVQRAASGASSSGGGGGGGRPADPHAHANDQEAMSGNDASTERHSDSGTTPCFVLVCA